MNKMKKIFSTLCMALVAVAMMAQEPVITFEKTEHDFGNINEADGRVTTEFVFKNEGMAPLILSNVRASCGCTTPTWTKEPIEPGKTGSITVTYNPNGRPGRFQKTVTITSNATEPTKKVFIKGEVIPKQAKPAYKYNIPVGDFSMKSKVIDLGVIKKGEAKTGELEYANLTQAEHTIELATNALDAMLISRVSLPTAKANETGVITLGFDTKNSRLYGPVEIFAYVVVDGKKEISDTYKLTVRGNIVEDFSKLSVEAKQNAPIIEVPGEINVGKLAAGKIHRYILPIKNTGVNPLEIRRVFSTEKALSFKEPKSIKSGKKGAVNVMIDTKRLEKGAYTREITVITNDYLNPVKRIKINFTIE